MPLSVNSLPAATLVKQRTQTLHAEVEHLLLPALENLRTRAAYAQILQMFYGYFHPLEQMIEGFITREQLPDMQVRRKAAAILQDLDAIDFSTQHLPQCQRLPAVQNSTQAFGALYVLEGSSLGGKVIARMLLQNHALSLSENAVTFFSGYKEETGKRWKTFVEAFNQQNDASGLVESANTTFAHLKSWMQHTLP